MIYIILGVVSGIATGVGIGGGTLLIIILTTLFGINQKVAQSCNLIFFIPTAIISILVNIKNKNINILESIPLIISGIIFSIIGSNIAINLDTNVLRKIFSIFLLIMAGVEIKKMIKDYRIKDTKKGIINEEK